MSEMNEQDREALRQLLMRRTQVHTKTPEEARAWLIKQGLYSGDGKLAPEFGGEKKSDD